MVLKAGTLINGYLIEGVLGAGAMALVYSAKNRLDQQVAIKILPEQLTVNPMAVKRFEREARLISQLDHPHIVRVLDFFYIDEDTTPCMVMQYLPGGTLTQHLQRNPTLTLVDMVDIIRQLSEALDYAHSLDIVHRDIKLDNVLLYDTGQVALSDFGLARALNETTMTNTGSLLGTPYYMSPEQIQPNRYPLDHRADLYALGIMSYVLTTGTYPFSGTDAASVLHQHLAAEPPVPTDLNPALPEVINPVLMRAIAKDPDTRYPSALAFAVAMMDAATLNPSLTINVKAVGTGDTLTIHPPTGGKSKRTSLPKQSAATPQPSRANRWIPIIALILGLGSLVIALGQSLTINRINQSRATQLASDNAQQPQLTNGGSQLRPHEKFGWHGIEDLCSQPSGEPLTLQIANYMPRDIHILRKDTDCNETEVLILPSRSSTTVTTYVGEVWRGRLGVDGMVERDYLASETDTFFDLGDNPPQGVLIPTALPSPAP